MGKKALARGENMRRALAMEAARIMSQQSLADFYQAKQKAAERLGVPAQSLPSNQEIEQALIEYQRLFGGDEHEQAVRQLREQALKAMEILHRFEPRLVGQVWAGTAHADSVVELHLFADTSEAVAIELMERAIPFRHGEREFRYSAERSASYPAFSFLAGGVKLEVVVFPPEAIRQAPLSRIDGKPMKRARPNEVRALL